MNSEAENAFYNDDKFLERESDLMYATLFRVQEVRSPLGARHLKQGLTLRHYMLQASRIFLRETAKPSRTNPLGAGEAIDASIHLNAYYLNMRGVLDNLAWFLQYDLDLFEGLREGDRGSGKINLFGNEFLAKLEASRAKLVAKLRSHVEWATRLKELRDPAAHRIPLYVVPGVIEGEETLEEYRRLERLSGQPAADLGGRSRYEILLEARSLARYYPVIISSLVDKLEARGIAAQVAEDHEHYLTIAEAVIDSIPAATEKAEEAQNPVAPADA